MVDLPHTPTQRYKTVHQNFSRKVPNLVGIVVLVSFTVDKKSMGLRPGLTLVDNPYNK